jgi:hypothetical protein
MIRTLVRVPEDTIMHLRFSFIEGDSNYSDNTITHLCFSLSKVIRTIVRIPENTHPPLSLSRVFECRWMFLVKYYPSSFCLGSCSFTPINNQNLFTGRLEFLSCFFIVTYKPFVLNPINYPKVFYFLILVSLLLVFCWHGTFSTKLWLARILIIR